MSWTLRILTVEGTAPVGLLGTVRAVGSSLTVGRGDGADWVLADARVSRSHARFEPADERLAVVPTGSGLVLIDGDPVTDRTVVDDSTLVQLGPVLLRAFSNAETASYDGPVLGRMNEPILRISTKESRAWLGAHELDLRPAAFRALRELARRPGAWVARDTLVNAIWEDPRFGNPSYVDKYMSQVRSALREVLASSQRSDPLLAALDALRDPTEDDRVRALLETRRGIGHRLSLAPEFVSSD